MSNTEDLVGQALAQLPAIEVDDLLGERVRQRASQELRRRRGARRLRRLEPTLAYAVAAAYLLWAFQAIIG